MEGMTRGELAKRTGLSTATIRYYEESGILPAPQRIANGYRIYMDDYLVKIKFIKDAKSLGYSLKEIQEGLQMLSQDMEAETLQGLVRDKIFEIDERIKSLHSIQTMLAGLLQTPKKTFITTCNRFVIRMSKRRNWI
ncbi:Cu(I)-responsive transcriptional regulator [Paenibacillus baekrokdamisoli]|uniref:Cu(I)-responsive transcriptional regulator n=1 Tax=Paenibacillus baekrokdamisoli TaxID=1712516 RepID=A0A3G9IYT6_9BACL|nr:MerR family transcriptional regulator [Paenibacillus baekrokdamisoli]MBB3068609.1 DNA-binding transcriptional MerR regulator [Paenibacillus baekrokdamisoli]BBH23442.1 Cu(I)-responsive transcriptional regulator [Paenibacillus baekrokdamisoli]